jgi:ABC-type polysaccharide/polyol phosphate export permease
VVLNGPIIRKVSFQGDFPVAAVSHRSSTFFSLVPLALFMVAIGAEFSASLLWLPLPLLSLTCFALGISLLLGTFNVFFRDVRYLYEAGILAWFYATPVFYPPEIIPDKFRFLLQVNPMYALLSPSGPPSTWDAPPAHLFIPGLAVSLLTLAIGWVVFHRYEARFIHYV